MNTEIQIDGPRFLINGRPTYPGVSWRGKPIEGLLMNSRMIQAVFDDENPQTARHWRYPDTGVWDADRNTREFCAALPLYRQHGLLAVTVGLQGGGSIYAPDVYNHYLSSAFAPDGALKPAWFNRLRRVLQAADESGMVVIVNFFYWKQARRFENDAAIRRATAQAAEWLLQTGHKNILVDVMNEVQKGSGLLDSENIHRLIEIVQQTTLNGRRLLVGTSIHPENSFPGGRWEDIQDFHLPHGNHSNAAELRRLLQTLKSSETQRKNPRPILINEDSTHLENFEVAVDEYASWGYYSQGYGCGGTVQQGRFNWLAHGREPRFEDLSGYQTLPVNWGINTPMKKEFFNRLKAITQGD